MKEVIVHGVRIASLLNRELCLTGIWHSATEKTVVQEKLIKATHAIKHSAPELRVSNLVIKGSLYENIEKLAMNYDAVLVILHKADLKSGLKAFRESSIAFLFVSGDSPEYLSYKNVLVPMDYRKASKDTALWASFLGRLNRSVIQVVYAHETDKEQAATVTKNLNFYKKFLTNLNVSHHMVAGKASSWRICSEVIASAGEMKGDVMLFAGSASISLLDLMVGLPEKRIIRKSGPLPILIVNPRKEICMVCE
ncbi:MAG TPA: hypothetical protein VFG54_16815 [Prolixibacteraceae bacterium]|nr:hypothetical protein [Prolixibacteraceae bacterium]